MRILGIHGSSRLDHQDNPSGFSLHDAAAVLLEDDRIVAAVEEERLDRIKHSNFFPREAVAWCLREAGVGLEQVDAVAFNVSEPAAGLLARHSSADPHRPVVTAEQLFAAPFQECFGVDVSSRVCFVHHHVAHAMSAVVPSGFEESLVLTIDGDGDGLSGAVFTSRGRELNMLKKFAPGQSLGNWYRRMMAFAGYNRFDEYKLMGLAPYGDPARFEELFRGVYKLLPEGDYTFSSGGSADYNSAAELKRMEGMGLMAQARKSGQPFEQVHRDFAAALQHHLERIVLHVLEHHRRATGQERLCLAGGVAHNCTLNGRILYSGMFREIYVQPAAHDAGGALGAAWAVARTQPSRERLPSLLLGPVATRDERELEQVAQAYDALVSSEPVEDIEARVADLLASGEVVAWVQGRAEFGPRALGNRSILADPRPAENRDRINRLIKQREGYRPFAPSVVEERAGDYFVLGEGQRAFPFMVVVLEVRPEHRALLGAVTHVDGTARVQTVSQEQNPRYHRLLRLFEERTGLPVLLNTSFNNNVEPIVTTAEEALTTLLTTELSYVAVGNRLFRKRAFAPAEAALGLVPGLDRSHKLVRRAEPSPEGWRWMHAIESTASPFFGEASAPVSKALYQALNLADGTRTLGALLDAVGAEPQKRESLGREAFELWARRVLMLRPLGLAPTREVTR